MDKLLLDSQDVIDMTGVKKKTLDYYCSKNMIKYSQPNGRKRYFLKEDVLDFFLDRN
jgi:DNA-binding transcriptional MerR regulator